MKLTGPVLVILVLFKVCMAQNITVPTNTATVCADLGTGVLGDIRDLLQQIVDITWTYIDAGSASVNQTGTSLTNLLNLFPTPITALAIPPFPSLPDKASIKLALCTWMKNILVYFGTAVKTLKSVISALPTLPSPIILPGVPTLDQGINFVTGNIQNILTSLKNVSQQLQQQLPPFPSAPIIINETWNSMAQWIQNLPVLTRTAVEQIFNNLIPYMVNFVQNLLKNIATGIVPAPPKSLTDLAASIGLTIPPFLNFPIINKDKPLLPGLPTFPNIFSLPTFPKIVT